MSCLTLEEISYLRSELDLCQAHTSIPVTDFLWTDLTKIPRFRFTKISSVCKFQLPVVTLLYLYKGLLPTQRRQAKGCSAT